MRSYSVEQNHYADPTEKGFRYAADFKIDFAAAAYATIVLTVLWNAKKMLVHGTIRTETTVTNAAISMSKSGSGWAVVAGEELWMAFKNPVIRFRKRFTLELPIAPAVSKIPAIGEMAKELEPAKD